MTATPLFDTINSPADLRQLKFEDLAQVATELRTDLIESVSKTGGHLGAGLGVVELTIALHYVFNTPDDRLVWDVGHQAYPHKLLTGRRARFGTLRQEGGISGFTRRAESKYDPFGAAHSSTSISAGLGMAVARDLKGETRNVIAVIGDGAMSAGMAFEALNNTGALDARMIVILNDNDMSIAPPSGALSAYLARLATGKVAQAKAPSNAPSYTKVFGQALVQEAKLDERIVAVTAAMPSGTGLDLFGEAFPTRLFDVGIAEQHGVTFAAGLATEGMKPFVAIYSSFLQRGYDQIVHDVAIQKLPVRFPIDRAGFVGADGPTHCGAFDVGFLAALPNFVVMAAADEAELKHMVRTAAEFDEGPISFRYPRGDGVGVDLPERGSILEIGRGRIMKEGSKIALLSFGTRLADCLLAAQELDAAGLSTTVADARFAKPLDEAMIRRLAKNHEILIIVEESAAGGFGAQVLHFMAKDGLLDIGLKIRSLTLPDEFTEQAKPEVMYAKAGLDQKGIVATALLALGAETKNLKSRARI